MAYRYDVYGLGNAIVDTEIQVEDTLLHSQGLDKGVMTLVSTDIQQQLLAGLDGYARHGAAGGSAANTMVGVSQFGGKACFLGKIGNDEQGVLYRSEMASAGVDFAVEATKDQPTGSCLVLVTPDGERTMQTSLGASSGLAPGDVDDERLKESQVLYVEGYLYGSPTGGDAAERAMASVQDHGAIVSLSLSDPGMAMHFRDRFKAAIEKYVDIVFCNEHEASIYAGEDSREGSLRALAEDTSTVFMTCGKDGSLVFHEGAITHVPGYRVPVVDTTGAGDLYAAGVLFGLTRNMSPTDAAKLGTFASARIVTQLGPRLSEPLQASVEAILSGSQPLS